MWDGPHSYLFAHQESGISPDLMTLAKGLGGGFPISACLATRDAALGMTVGMHGSTFGGNPLAGAAANAVLDIIAEEGMLAEVRRKGELLRASLEDMASRYPAIITDVRGRGLMLGVKTTHGPQNLVEALRTQGKVLTIPAGDNVVRVLPPLIVSDQEIQLFAARFERTLALL